MKGTVNANVSFIKFNFNLTMIKRLKVKGHGN